MKWLAIIVVVVSSALLSACEETTYEVTFYDGDEVLETIEVGDGEYVEAISGPERDHHDFTGWFTCPDAIETFDFNEAVTEDVEVHAGFEPVTYCIVFKTHSGSEVETIETHYESEIDPPGEPTREGYQFEGWYEDESYETPFVFSTMPGEDITLHARWEAIGYVLHFETYGGSEVEDVVADYGEELEPPEAPSKEGHSFEGWYTDETFEEPFTFDVMPDEDVTLYAKWALESYSIDFNTHGGTRIDALEVDFEASITLPEAPEKECHEFAGWYMDAAYETPFDYDTMPAEDITLHARWEEVLPYEGAFAIDLEDAGMAIVIYLNIDSNSQFTLARDEACSDVVNTGEVIEDGDEAYRMVYDERDKDTTFVLSEGTLVFTSDLRYLETFDLPYEHEEGYLKAVPVEDS